MNKESLLSLIEQYRSENDDYYEFIGVLVEDINNILKEKYKHPQNDKIMLYSDAIQLGYETLIKKIY